jgi:hypothetical protein
LRFIEYNLQSAKFEKRLSQFILSHLQFLFQARSLESISINQFIATAVAEKMAALMTEDYLQARAQRGDRDRYEAALAQVPDAEPEAQDRL